VDRTDFTAIVSVGVIVAIGVGAYFFIRKHYNPDWLANIVFRLDQTSLTLFSMWLLGLGIVALIGLVALIYWGLELLY
jgi:hypothetical protein